jgi:hypothetical protein
MPVSHTEETAMHPDTTYDLVQARIAALRQQAQRDALIRADRRGHADHLQDARPLAGAAWPHPSAVALIAIDGRIRPWRLGALLGAALEAHLSVEVLDGAEVPGEAVANEPVGPYRSLLDQAQARHDLVLLVGGLALGEPWTRFCLRHADRVLALTGGGPVPPALRDYPELQGCDLVACDAAPGALNGWAAALDPARSHLIRDGEFRADIARIARQLAGTSVGIVLSGGVRAFTHIGVLDEITAAGVTIDRVAGISMGAVIGALFAMGYDPDRIGAICSDEWAHGRQLRDLILPRRALIRGKRVRPMLHRIFGNSLIEELPRSFVCGRAGLRSRHMKLTRHGPLGEAVELSIPLPIIAPAEARARLLFGAATTAMAAERYADLVIQPCARSGWLLDFDQPDVAREAGRMAARKALERAPASLIA